ncbi:phospholipase A2 [Amycolatopsis magusensis]|uniref:phospholipase A2 n=1 Tax=Amycolatopsis magusensis TaxID=882444 RepID=UPI0037B9C8E7
MTSTAVTAPITVQGDGCTFSPDSFFGANFRPACDAHDKCYSRGSGTPRLVCDQAFHSALTVACVNTFPSPHPMRIQCTQAAMGYYVAVRQYGRSHYEGYGDPV